jgi:hypothetical protein
LIRAFLDVFVGAVFGGFGFGFDGIHPANFGQADRRIVYSIQIDPYCGKSSQNANSSQMMMRYP